jgi:hypothetical protein
MPYQGAACLNSFCAYISLPSRVRAGENPLPFGIPLLQRPDPPGILIHSQFGHQGIIFGYDFPLKKGTLILDLSHLQVRVRPDVISEDRFRVFLRKGGVSP